MSFVLDLAGAIAPNQVERIMPHEDQIGSYPGTSVEDAVLHIKRDRVLVRLDHYASALVTGPALRARTRDLLSTARDLEDQLPLLALASTLFDGFQNNPDRRLGQKVRTGAKQRGAEVSKSVAEKHQTWQRLAEEIWVRRPGLSKAAVARLVAPETEGSFNTIRLRIRCPPSQS